MERSIRSGCESAQWGRKEGRTREGTGRPIKEGLGDISCNVTLYLPVCCNHHNNTIEVESDHGKYGDIDDDGGSGCV